MTPGVKQLQKLAIAYKLHQYQHDVNCKSYGLEAAEKLNVSAETVFKTLVVEVDNSFLAVAIVPVIKQLSLKKLAKALHAKKIKMADANKVQNSTGYVLGGVSPLGQKKALVTVLDKSAVALNTIFVSGGKRGLEIELTPENLVLSLQATYANITSE
ncbi:Cys-tRNA(Pro) deacylase [Colwellia sp. PAMC 21821]|uniref:Cys-tRNA(Pro) deacylase n=1 Tax=Colwellia sp. PAMC 21821 TaxID=1816219 RepID=UPI0009BD588C|nr:Cys-tRNA(Pro) deacylase [Colwellia sp. PAMC 21821]ARD42916.1 aminoacyl-tRNA deacylase [Colwellia sp. PAMC 21821]